MNIAEYIKTQYQQGWIDALSTSVKAYDALLATKEIGASQAKMLLGLRDAALENIKSLSVGDDDVE